MRAMIEPRREALSLLRGPADSSWPLTWNGPKARSKASLPALGTPGPAVRTEDGRSQALRELREAPALGKASEREPGGRGARDLEAAGSRERRQGAVLRLGVKNEAERWALESPPELSAGQSAAAPPPARQEQSAPPPGAAFPRQPAPRAVGRSSHLANCVSAAPLAEALGCGLPAVRESMARPVQLAPGSLALVLCRLEAQKAAGATEEPGGRAGVPRLPSRQRALLLERAAGARRLAAGLPGLAAARGAAGARAPRLPAGAARCLAAPGATAAARLPHQGGG
ncbi:hypothetical protein H8959_011849 [Pygathrix nigripes]